MLERITAADGVVFYRSPLLAGVGVPHGFSTRLGGVSRGPFDSLNLGNPNGCPAQDDRANIAANYARLHAAVGLAGRERAYVHQVHADAVATARAGGPFDCSAQADAVACDDSSRAAAVRVADCVPVLLATADGRAVAAVHAGWRGVVAGVVARAVEAVRGLPAGRDAPLLAAIGPAIGFDAFEVGPEVAAAFEGRFGGDADGMVKASPRAGKAMVDLRAAIRVQLLGLGLDVGSIDASNHCTFRDAGEFFSHRREDGVTGRMAAIVGPG